MVTFTGFVQNGQIHIEGNESLPEGAQVLITIIGAEEDHDEVEEVRGMTAEELLNSGLVGMWADRDDIEDSAKFAEELRRRAERRE